MPLYYKTILLIEQTREDLN